MEFIYMQKLVKMFFHLYLISSLIASFIAMQAQAEAFFFDLEQPHLLRLKALVTIQNTSSRLIQRWRITILFCDNSQITKVTATSNKVDIATGYYHINKNGTNCHGTFNSKDGIIKNNSIHASMPLFNTLISFSDLRIIEKFCSDLQPSGMSKVKIDNKEVSPLIEEGENIEGLVIRYTSGVSKEVQFLQTRTVQNQKVPTKMAVHINSQKKKMLIDLRKYRKKKLADCSNFDLSLFLKGSLDFPNNEYDPSREPHH